MNLEAHAPGAAKPKAEDSGKSRYAVSGPKDNPDPHVARAAALRDAAEFGRVGILGGVDADSLDEIVSGILGGAPGGVIGGVPGGVVGGAGGLGLRGSGSRRRRDRPRPRLDWHHRHRQRLR